MRKIFYITLVTLLFSCSKNNEQEKTIYDFGMVEYEEPFRGILKSQPSILKQSLKYPPYKWLAPDTMSLQKTFIVDFNEDAVRSNAKATLYFVDLNNSPLDGVSFRLADGSISENLVTIIADSLHKEITIICDIHPSIGEQVKTGKITIAGNDLDQINSSSLQQDHMMLAEWKVEQKLNIPWLLWLLWLTTVIIIIVVAIVIVKFIIVVAAKAAKYILCFMSTSFVAIDYSLGAPLSITEGGKGRWTGRRGDSTYIFDLKQRPKTTNYGNMNNQTFGELGKDLGDSNPQVKYRKGFPVFDRDPATKSKRPLEVSFREGIGPYLKKKSNGTIDRQFLHNAAFEKMAKKYGMSIEELRVFKGDSSPVCDLAEKWNCTQQEVWQRCRNPHQIQRVLHEVEDGKRVQLVPRIYHDNVTHSGGVEKVAKNIF